MPSTTDVSQWGLHNVILTVGLDFDGTLATKRRHPEIGQATGAAPWLKILTDVFNSRLILWTCREDKDTCIDWCKSQGIHIFGVDCDRDGQQRCRKPRVDVFVDDKAAFAPLVWLDFESGPDYTEPHPCINWAIMGPHLVNMAVNKQKEALINGNR